MWPPRVLHQFGGSVPIGWRKFIGILLLRSNQSRPQVTGTQPKLELKFDTSILDSSQFYDIAVTQRAQLIWFQTYTVDERSIGAALIFEPKGTARFHQGTVQTADRAAILLVRLKNQICMVTGAAQGHCFVNTKFRLLRSTIAFQHDENCLGRLKWLHHSRRIRLTICSSSPATWSSHPGHHGPKALCHPLLDSWIAPQVDHDHD